MNKVIEVLLGAMVAVLVIQVGRQALSNDVDGKYVLTLISLLVLYGAVIYKYVDDGHSNNS